MKKHYLPGHTWPRLSFFVFFILACLTRLHAQTIYPAANPDQFLSADVSPTLQNVNCDMLRNHHVRSIVWEGTGGTNVFVTKAANAFPGPVISPAYPFYYQVNSGAVNYPAVISAPLAMSSTSDYGSDLLTAWYDNNGSIFYKLTTDITAYRQANTGISGTTAAGTCTVYPNPAAGYLYVSDLATAESYDITTITGQHVLNGTFIDPVNARIDIGGLANGTYMITVRNKAGISSPIKFVKM